MILAIIPFARSQAFSCVLFCGECACYLWGRNWVSIYSFHESQGSNRRSLTTAARVLAPASPRGIYGVQKAGTGSLSEYFDLPLSVPFYQCSILIFMLVLLVSEGRTVEAWRLCNTSDGVLETEVYQERKVCDVSCFLFRGVNTVLCLAPTARKIAASHQPVYPTPCWMARFNLFRWKLWAIKIFQPDVEITFSRINCFFVVRTEKFVR